MNNLEYLRHEGPVGETEELPAHFLRVRDAGSLSGHLTYIGINSETQLNCFRGDTGQRGEGLAAIFSCGVLKDLPFPLVIVPLLVCRGEQLFVYQKFVIRMNQYLWAKIET